MIILEKYLFLFIVKYLMTLIVLTDGGEKHVVEEEGDGHNDEDQLAGLPGRVEVGADGGARHVLSSLRPHRDLGKIFVAAKIFHTIPRQSITPTLLKY